MNNKVIYIFVILIISLSACKSRQRKQNKNKPQTKPHEQVVYMTAGPDSNAVLVADSVIYTVYLSNPDSMNEWRSYSLRYMNRDKLVDLIFDGIYSGHLKAYSYSDWVFGKKVVIPIDSVKKLEVMKKRIGQIEFVERWFYSPQANIFYKQVLEATLAYELYDSKGKVKGYAPLFKVFFNDKSKKPIAK